ncbi:MAG: NADH-quinone oxidoreductase subunit NuoE [Vicinamibacterales bacterium]
MSFHAHVPYGTPLWHKSERKLADEGPPFAFTAENRAALEEIAARYPPDRRKSALLPALYLVQAQQGHITLQAMRHVADVIGCTAAEVEDVVSYYVMYFTRPVGKYVIQVCRTLSCALAGAERVTEELAKVLHIGVNETDAARDFTLMEMECLGACDRAPVIMVNNEFWHECQRPEDAGRLVSELRNRGLAALSGCHHKKE